MRGLPADNLRRASGGGFTLIELVIVMVLLGIAASLVAPHMVRFFQGRVLSSEARRLVALTHYGQSRATAEGIPVMLWVDPKASSFGLTTSPGVAANPGKTVVDAKAVTYTTDSGVFIDTVAPETPVTSEDGDERLGVPAGQTAIRFMPDGFFDDASPSKITLKQSDGSEIDIVQTANRLGYEIAPAKAS